MRALNWGGRWQTREEDLIELRGEDEAVLAEPVLVGLEYHSPKELVIDNHLSIS